MIRANRAHRSWCYICRARVQTCTGLYQQRYRNGWGIAMKLCPSCNEWLRAVADMARYRQDWDDNAE